MAVYVDALFETAPFKKPKPWGCQWTTACHMWADDPEELHYMARRIALKESWFQPHPRVPHYDLTPNKRASAIEAGAIEGNLREYFKQLRSNEGK